MGVPYAEVIGDPIAHSKSPLIHKYWLEKLGLAGEFRKTRVPRGELADYIATRRRDPDWRGCSVTIPHKQAIMALLDDNEVSWARAANCVSRKDGRLIGRNTDMSGIGKALPDFVGTGDPVCIVGAGGAASAAIAELDILAVFQFNLIARDAAKARALVEPYGEHGRVFAFDRAAEAIDGCVGLINASPLGMTGFEAMPEAILSSLGDLYPRGFVIDLVYAPVRTELLSRAAELGLSVGDGLTVLLGQAEEAFSLFFGAPPPVGHDAELRRLLTS